MPGAAVPRAALLGGNRPVHLLKRALQPLLSLGAQRGLLPRVRARVRLLIENDIDVLGLIIESQ